jgi:hypothetical protein
MQTRTYQLYTTASQANAASVQFIARGVITAIKWAVALDSLVDNSAVNAELSFQQFSQLGTNGGTGILDCIALFQNVQAASTGMDQAGLNQLTTGLRIPIMPGNILYLNTSLTAGVVKAIVYVQE